jgi:hypothetical protein
MVMSDTMYENMWFNVTDAMQKFRQNNNKNGQ